MRATLALNGLILLIQLWATKIGMFYFYQVWCLDEVDNFQKFCSRRNKVLVGILKFIIFFLSQTFSTCGKGTLVFVKYWCQLKY